MGKSLQSHLLVQRLAAVGFKATCVEPIKDNRLIRYMLKTGAALKWPNVFQLVQFANRLWFETFTLDKLIETHDYVVCDRWALSTWVYGLCTGCWLWLAKATTNGLRKPDATIVLTGSPFGVDRELDSYENNTALQDDIATTYQTAITMGEIVQMCEGKSTIREVKVHGPPEHVTCHIMEALEDVLYGFRVGEEHA